MSNNMTVFSEFEARSMRFILGEGDVYDVKCVGKVENEATIRNIVKNCRGSVAKKRTRPTGEGTMKLTAHIPYELYIRLHDMQRDELAAGVYAYGQSSIHPEVCVTADIFDEDDNEKFKAWPRCVISTGANQSIENGADEVAEVELEIGYMPDDYGEGFYEALAKDLDSTIKTAWLNSFTPELVRASENSGSTSGGSTSGGSTTTEPTYEAVDKTAEGYSSSNPSTLGWYERSGEEGSYVYTASEDTEVDGEKTYYVVSTVPSV